MEETFERVEEHLYKRQYQTAAGEWRTKFFAAFTDWKGKRRKFPLGGSLDHARDELGRLRTLNKGGFDWGKEKAEREKAKIQADRLTVARYLPTFLETKRPLPSYGFWKSCSTHLERLLGTLTLDEITRSKIAEYKQQRLLEPIQRRGKPVKGSHVRSSTVNREITTLIGILNLAAEN